MATGMIRQECEDPKEATMAWTVPAIEEVTCGMEINMYFPAEDEGELF